MTNIEFCRALLKEKNIKLTFKKKINKENDIDGYYDSNLRRITVRKGMSLVEKLCAIFHEMGHAHCYDNGLWREYHAEPPDTRTALRAEVWIEDWAEKEFKKYFSVPYERFYNFDENSRNFIKGWIDDNS